MFKIRLEHSLSFPLRISSSEKATTSLKSFCFLFSAMNRKKNKDEQSLVPFEDERKVEQQDN